jgi:RNA polymerase sigma-70 factor (ECF subfamily)
MSKILQKTKVLSEKKLDSIQREMAVVHSDHKNALLMRALYKTNDTEVSQDIVQTTFLKTLVYLQKGGKIDLMRSFLNHVLNDLIVDEYRSRKNKSMSLDVLLDNGFEPSTNDFEKHINFLDGKGTISLIPQLPKKYELVLRLRYINGLSLKEMALITNQSENTVAVQVHRGLAKLRKLYESQTGSHTLK